MSNPRTEAAARKIAGALFESETAIESALAATAAVMASLPSFKKEAGLTVFHAQEVLEQASELAALMTQARRKAGDLHRKMEATQRQIGLDHIALGPVGKPSEEFAAMKEVRRVA